MSSVDPASTPALPKVLVTAGITAAVTTLASDIAGFGSSPGLGSGQLLLLAAGLAMTCAGLIGSAPLRRSLAAAWRAAPRLTPRETFWLAAATGLFVGILEIGHVFLLKSLWGSILWLPLDLAWTIPVSYLVLFSTAGGILAAGLRWWAHWLPLPALVFALGGLTVWSQSLIHPQRSDSAVVLLAAGVATLLARAAWRQPERWRTWPRRSAPWLLGTLAIAMGLPAVRWAGTQLAAENPATRVAGAANAIVVVLEAVRADHSSLYGYDRPTTPNLDGIAARGVLFETCASSSSATIASLATLFTGRWPSLHGAGRHARLAPNEPTLAEVLQRSGYATGGFVGNLADGTREHGIARGFAHYEDDHLSLRTLLWSSALGRRLIRGLRSPRAPAWLRNDAARVTQGFLDWSDELEGRPFFAFLEYADARGRDGESYDDAIVTIDRQLGVLIEHLRATAKLDHTLLIVTADHGQQLGEHRLHGHGNSLYWNTLRVPLVVGLPGHAAAGQRVERPVSLRDLPATVLDVLGLPTEPELPGHSLAPSWAASRPSARPTLSPLISQLGTRDNAAPMCSIVCDRLHYIRNGDGTEEVYDLGRDIAEEHNLVESLAADTLHRLRTGAEVSDDPLQVQQK